MNNYQSKSDSYSNFRSPTSQNPRHSGGSTSIDYYFSDRDSKSRNPGGYNEIIEYLTQRLNSLNGKPVSLSSQIPERKYDLPNFSCVLCRKKLVGSVGPLCRECEKSRHYRNN